MAITVKLGVLSVALVLAIFAGTAYSRSKVITLDEDNWDMMLEQEWMVELYVVSKSLGRLPSLSRQ